MCALLSNLGSDHPHRSHSPSRNARQVFGTNQLGDRFPARPLSVLEAADELGLRLRSQTGEPTLRGRELTIHGLGMGMSDDTGEFSGLNLSGCQRIRDRVSRDT